MQGDIGDSDLVAKSITRTSAESDNVNFAAESHVDRSIHGPDDFIQTNIMGTYRLLEEARSFFNTLSDDT